MHFHGDPFHFCLLSQPYKSLASISVVPSFFSFIYQLIRLQIIPSLKDFLFFPASFQKFTLFLVTHRYKGVNFFYRLK